MKGQWEFDYLLISFHGIKLLQAKIESIPPNENKCNRRFNKTVIHVRCIYETTLFVSNSSLCKVQYESSLRKNEKENFSMEHNTNELTNIHEQFEKRGSWKFDFLPTVQKILIQISLRY